MLYIVISELVDSMVIAVTCVMLYPNDYAMTQGVRGSGTMLPHMHLLLSRHVLHMSKVFYQGNSSVACMPMV